MSTTDDTPVDPKKTDQLEQRKLSDLTDFEIADLTQQIKTQAAAERPLVGELEPISTLEKEYRHAVEEEGEGTKTLESTYVIKIKSLEENGWKSIRRLRGDGDCFYRSFAYSYIERLLDSETAVVEATLSRLESLLPLLDQAGYAQDIYEDFYDPLRSLITSCINTQSATPPHPTSTSSDSRSTIGLNSSSSSKDRLTSKSLLSEFNDPEVSNSIVVFLRLLTSAFLQSHPEDFTPFLFGLEEDDPKFFEPLTLPQFCRHYVEAVNQEADHIQITALTRALGVNTVIAYLDQSGGGGGNFEQGGGGGGGGQQGHAKVDFHQFEENSTVALKCALLYRPGHYDCLYKSNPL